MSIRSVIMIGAGNAGFHLGLRLYSTGVNVLQVFSRTEEKALRLAGQTASRWTTKLRDIAPNADCYIIAVHDDDIGQVSETLYSNPPLRDKLFVHTSGSTPSSVFKPYFHRYGVFYPLQTLSISRPADFTDIPICVFAPDREDEDDLFQLGQTISRKVSRIDDEQRAVLHVAAVFVNNFANHLFHIGHQILEKEGLPFDLLRPLIRETAMKVQEDDPSKMQTGPAVRGDRATIERHLGYLEKFPEWKELYEMVTKSISV
jgi:predicted short-subunit dehydrogenase-like oxidoreductase (DUF2520 family)